MLSDFKATHVRLEEFLLSMDLWIEMTLFREEQILDMFCQAVLEIVRMPKYISGLNKESVYYFLVANCHKFDKHCLKVNKIYDIKK